MSDANFLNKILLLLDKTKDTLIEDLKKEFISVRTALDENAKTDEAFKLKSEFSKKVNIIDAVFAKVGYDISHYEQLGNLKQQVLSMLDTVDNLTDDVQQLTTKNDIGVSEVAEFVESAVPHVQTLLSIVKNVADIEWDSVAKEMGDVGNDIKENIQEQFLNKEFARKVLDHILITLLKNAKDVFHDEIEYVRMSVVNGVCQMKNTAEELANSIVSEITSSANSAQEEITKQVNALLRETLDEYTDIKQRLGNEVDKMKAFIEAAGEDIVGSNIYAKITRAMSITYSILDFLGVVREVRVTLRLPGKIQDIISDAEKLVSESNSELSKAINNLSSKIESYTNEATSGIESLQGDVVTALQDASTTVANATAHVTSQMDQNLQITKEVTGLSVAGLGAMQTQLLTLYGNDGKGGEIGKIGNGINGMLNDLSGQLKSTCATVKSEIGEACKTINGTLETIKNISYPMTIVTVSWSSVESLFTQPVSHFKSLYPINNVDDVESLMRRIMGILHCINPDIPDFDSLRNMLESLLKRLQEKVIMLVNEAKKKAKETAQEIWNKFQPIIATIRKVIDMLKEMALALKEKMYGVLNDLKAEMSEVMNGAKQIIDAVQNQIKEQAGYVLNEAGKRIKDANLESKLNEVFGNIDEVNLKIVAAAGNESGTSAAPMKLGGPVMRSGAKGNPTSQEMLSEAVRKWVEAQSQALKRIDIPRIVRRTITEPLIHCASGILQDALGWEKTPDFMAAYNLLHDIASLRTLLNRKFVLQPIAVSGNNQMPPMEFSFKQVAGSATSAIQTALNKIDGAVQGVNLNMFDINVESIVVPQLQAWAYGVTSSIKTVVDPKVWKTRMDNLITQLQAEFQNDLQNVTSLISKDGANRLIADAGAVKDQLKNNLQINDYITIVQTAMNDVVLPNPELYFNSLKTTLANIVSQLGAQLATNFKTLQNQLSGKIDQIKKIINDLLTALKGVEEDVVKNAFKAKGWAEDVVKEAWERFKTVRDAVMDIIKRIQEMAERVRAFIAQTMQFDLNAYVNHLKESLKNRLEDMALEIWNNLKSEIITPILNTIKDEIMNHIRALVKKALQQLTDALTQVGEVEGELAKALNKVPGLKDLKEAINTLAKNVENVIRTDSNVRKALQGIDGFDPNNPISDLKQLPVIFEHLKKKNVTIPEDIELELQLSSTTFKIPADYICWAQSLLQATFNFVQSDMKAKDIINLVVAVYKGIPDNVKDEISDLMPELPELPDNGLTQLMKKVSCSYDLDNKFCNVTLLNLQAKEKGSKTITGASLLVQVFAFVGTYNPEKENESVKVTVIDDNKNGIDDTTAEEDKGKPALYIMFFLKGELELAVMTENHQFQLHLKGSAGEAFGGQGGDGKEMKLETSERSLGFCLTKKTDDDPTNFHPIASLGSLSGLMDLVFQRRNDDGSNPAKLLNTKYLDLNVGNYPQVAYIMYNSAYPDLVKQTFKYETAEGFTFGYMAKLDDMEIILKLRQNEFFKSFLKDDISAKFSLALIYDYQKGFDFGTDYSFHIDLDCSNLKLGQLNLQGLGIDIGSVKNDWGTLQLGVGSTFSIDLDAVAFSFENLGVALNVNVLKPDFSIGDWKLGCDFKFPTGVGISINAPGVKGSGLISYEEATGELMGALELKIVSKFGVSAFMLVDLGTAEGHSFSFVGLISTTFTPGIPLGMGFSLTGIGGCLGLERMIDSDAIRTAVHQGTLASVFFVEDLQQHLAEMKATALALFPAKKDQFFVGLLGQISYAPVLSCSFGLMMQFPNPTTFLIVGSLKVGIKGTDVIRINIQFAGEIDFQKGIWFDASIIDSEIVGIKLEGDMAFRLFWGGETKGFLLSIGGFHPNYTPEPGMMVSGMKRLAMKLDYKILKVGLETYLAVTSNSFQIGAHLDLKIGWNKFGIFGYAGFDALFQFDPFMFMFDVECGVSVKCGTWTLMSLDLAFSLSGPRPWHVSGKAKFWFLFLPIKVDFSLEWGNKQPELPNKQIEVKALFEEQIKNNDNWTISDTAQTDDDVVVDMKHEKDELLVQPFETIHFNQSAVPLQLELQENRVMDLCNNAVPTDYSDLIITSFTLSDKTIAKEAKEDNLTNDFAPALYYNLTNQEKLSTPSYKKYVSGFSVSATEGSKKGTQTVESIGTQYCMKQKGEDPKTINVKTADRADMPVMAAAPKAAASQATMPQAAAPTASEIKVLSNKTMKFGERVKVRRLVNTIEDLKGEKTRLVVTSTSTVAPELKEEIGKIVGSLQNGGDIMLASIVKGVKENKMRRAAYPLKTRRAFDRYIQTLDSINENN